MTKDDQLKVLVTVNRKLLDLFETTLPKGSVPVPKPIQKKVVKPKSTDLK